MKQTPKRIWLKEDREDPDYIVWGNDQPANHDDGVEYIRADLVQRHLTSAMHSDGEGQCQYFDALVETIRKSDPFAV